MFTDSEYIRETPSEEILSRFPTDPRSERMNKLFYKDGEIFVGDEHADRYQKQDSFIYSLNLKKSSNNNEFDNTLCFWCYCEEDGLNDEICRIRIYMLYYHLKEDTLSLSEPPMNNFGTVQARAFYHQKVPLDQRVDNPFLHWKDLNTAINIQLFGRQYRITSCDKFTKIFLEEHGIKLNEQEPLPKNPWIVKDRTIVNDRDEPCPSILSFRCYWYDCSNDFRSYPMKRIFKMLVFSSDHTVSLIEETKEFERQLFLKRIHVPRSSDSNGVRRYYHSWDFRPGTWVEIFSRLMFISDCITEETKQYIAQQITKSKRGKSSAKIMEQDQSLMNSNNAPVQLTFLCHMVNPSPSLFKKEFILSYNMSTQKIEVVERDKNRKWRAGKSFVPCTSAKKLSERHFVPGRIVQLSQWKFYLIEGDEVTTEYLKEKVLKEGRDFDHELSTNQNQF